jgi:hypothetical protein
VDRLEAALKREREWFASASRVLGGRVETERIAKFCSADVCPPYLFRGPGSRTESEAKIRSAGRCARDPAIRSPKCRLATSKSKSASCLLLTRVLRDLKAFVSG